MRQPGALSAFCLGVFLIQTTGCHSFRPIPVNFSAVYPGNLETRERYRFTLENGRTEDLYYLGTDSMAIILTKKPGREPRHLDRGEIVIVEEIVTEVPATILLTIAILIPPLVLMGASLGMVGDHS